MTYSTAAVILALAHAAAAIAQPAPRVVARPAASSTTPGFTGIMTAIAIAPDGRVAFNADVRELAPGGGFVITRPPLVERDGQLVTAYAGLVSPTDSFVTVVGVDELGNVLVRGAPPPAMPLARAYAIDRPVGGPLRIVTRGQVAPGIPDRTVNIISNPTPIGRQEVRYLPPLFKFPFNVSLMPNTAPTAAMLRGSENGAVLLTTQTQLNTPDAPPVSAANIPTDVNANGDFLDFGSSSIQLYHDGVVRSSPPAPAPVPGGEPNERLASRLSAALGPDGSVIAAYSTSTGSIVVLMGQVDNLQLVFRSRQTITSPRQTAQPGLSIDTVVVWFDADGSGYVRANSLTPLPAGQLSPHCIIRVKPGDTPRIAYIASEPVRRRSGELVPTFLTSSINRTFRTPASGKLVWVVPLSNLNPAVCTLTVDGDPAVMLEGSTAVGDPPIVLGSSLLPPIAPSETPPPLVSNQRGDIAAIVLLQSSSGTAVVASPAYRFTCGDPDFNNDGVYPTDQDMIDFFNVYAGAPCPTLRCDTLDFNRNGSFPEDQDVIDFLTVLAGGSCQ